SSYCYFSFFFYFIIHILFFFHPFYPPSFSFFFFLYVSSPSDIYTLSLHDALPIWPQSRTGPWRPGRSGRHRSRRLPPGQSRARPDRKSTRLNSSHVSISYAVFCLKKKKILSFVL